MTILPIVMTAAGLQPQAPADLRATLVSKIVAMNPGYTANLPGSLVEDLASTSIYAVSLCDQAKVDLINSLTPYGANPFILNQLGALYGIAQGAAQNTSVYVVFTGNAGFVIQPGFIVADGTYQYIIQDGGIIGSSGVSAPLFAVSSTPGTFAVPSNTVTQLGTSVPVSITLTVTNPQPGTPGGDAQTVDEYRAAILQGIRSPGQGTASAIKTALQQIAGVQARLISMRAVTGGWQILCGGGDPYQVAGAIYQNMADISALKGSSVSSTRDVTVSVIDTPNAYSIKFVNPPQQSVLVNLQWNTTAINFVSDDAAAQYGSAALLAYINSIPAGQPIIVYMLESAFRNALATLIAPELITRMVFSIAINGVGTAPLAGTGIINGDPESYFLTQSTLIEIDRS